MLELPPPPTLHSLNIRHNAYGINALSLSSTPRSSRKETPSRQPHKSDISPASTCPDTAEGKLFSPPQPPRGRTLQRPIRHQHRTSAIGDTANLNAPRRSSPLPSSLPLAFSPRPQQVMQVVTTGDMRPLVDDELLFQMSPVVSPKHSSFFDIQETSTLPTVEPAAQQILAERWDDQAKFMLGAKQKAESKVSEVKLSLDDSSKRPRHHRVRSALVIGTRSDVKRCSTKDGRTRFDCTDCCSPSSEQRSPPNVRSSKKQPFLYTFPTFDMNSVPTLPMPIHRNGLHHQTVFGSSPELTDANAMLLGVGPIRARNLRIQSKSSLISSDELASVHGSEAAGEEDGEVGEEADGDDEGEGFIPGTFGSDAFDDFEHQHLADEEEEGYAVSQPCSSSTSSSCSSSFTSTNGTEFDDSDVIPRSLLASFPVRRAATETESEPASLLARRSEFGGRSVGLPRSAARFYLGTSPKRSSGSFSSRRMEQ